MISSITFRHRTEYKLLCQKIENECSKLTQLMPNITRIIVIFDKETQHENASTSILCHISLHMKHKKHIDIYEHQRNEYVAYEKAIDRVENYLHKLHSKQTRIDKLHLSHRVLEHSL